MLRAVVTRVLFALIVLIAALDVAAYSGTLKSEDALSTDEFLGVAPGTNASNGRPQSAAVLAEQDSSDSLPGRYVPTQGRLHTGPYPLSARVQFCQPVVISNDCYASNPPTSGLHLPVQRHVVLADGNEIDVPPAPAVYEFPIPREAIPHLEEHAGVYVGYNCADGCGGALERAKSVVSEALSRGKRLVMSPDPDLDDGVIAVASWTRVDSFEASSYSDKRLRAFIDAHSCRFDPEGFCK